MASNPYVNKVEYGGQTLIDLTADTVTPATLARGVTAHDKSGNMITGTMETETMPTGSIIQMMGKTAPDGYLACDGTVYNIADYAALAAYFAAQFDASNYFGGDGTTTFAVPDLRGEFLRGAGTNGHANQGGGAAVGTHQDATIIPEIIYNFSVAFGVRTNPASEINGWTVPRDADSRPDGPSVTGRQLSWSGSSFSDTIDSPTYTSRPTNTSVLYCIKT